MVEISKEKRARESFERMKQVVLGFDKVQVGIELKTDTRFNDLGLDSLELVELIMAFKEEFGIEIPDDQAEKIKTVQEAIDYIKSNTSG